MSAERLELIKSALLNADAKAQAGDEQAAADAKLLASEYVALKESLEAADLDTPPPEKDDTDGYAGAFQTFMKGVMLGSYDEAVGGASAALDQMLGLSAKQAGILGEDEVAFLDQAEQLRQVESNEQRAWAEENPLAAFGLELAGGVASPVSWATAGAAAAGGAAKTAGVAALESGLYGFADAEGDVADRAKNAAMYGAGGAVGGAAMAGAVKGVKGVVAARQAAKLKGQAADVISKVDDELKVQVAQTGRRDQTAWDNMLQATGYTDDDIRAAVQTTGTRPKIPSIQEANRDAKAIMDIRRNGTRDPDTYLGKLAERRKALLRPVENVLGSASTTLRNASKPLLKAVREFERETLIKQTDDAQRVHGLEKLKYAVDPQTYRSISKHLHNGDFERAKTLAPDEFGSKIDAARDILKELADEQRKIGYLLDDSTNYWPRRVKDLEGFREALSGVERTELDQHLIDVAKRTKKGTLTQEQKARATANWYTGKKMAGEGKPGHMKKRTIPYVSDEMIDYYEDPITAMMQHIHRAHEDIAMKKFFNKSGAGGNLQKMLIKQQQAGDPDVDAQLISDLDGAITELLQNQRLSGDEADAVRRVLSARFGGGRASMSQGYHNLRAGITATKLAQFDSTVTQIGDLWSSVYVNGLRPTLAALVKGGKYSVDDVGVNNVIAQDVRTGVTRADRYTDNLLKWSGFKFIDRFGKNTFIKSSERRLGMQLKKPGGRGEQAFRKQWADYYDDAELDNIIDAFRTGERNDYAAMHLFHELSDIQPITSLEMPIAYMNNPNARILYTLKSFIIKQIDIARRAAQGQSVAGDPFYRAIASERGRAFAGASNLAKFATTYAVLTGNIEEAKDWMKGGEYDPDDLSDNYVDALLDLAHLNRYYTLNSTLKQGDVVGWAVDFFVPPIPVLQEASAAGISAIISDDDRKTKEKAMKLIKDVPLAGRIVYGHTDAGQKRVRKQERKEEKAKWFD